MTQDEKNELGLIVRDEAGRVILQHITLCPFTQLGIEKRLRDLESRFSILIGFMVGSGLLGGVAGAVVSKLLGT